MRQSIARNGWPAPLTILFLVFLFAPCAHAQETLRSANGHPPLQTSLLLPPSIPEPTIRGANFRPNVPAKPRKMSAAQRRAWYLLVGAEHGAALLDARTTRDALHHYQELDPLLRPFARSAALYPVMQIAPLGFDWLARRLATNHYRWVRDIWWLPQAAATAGFIWAGVHNLNLPPVPGTPSP